MKTIFSIFLLAMIPLGAAKAQCTDPPPPAGPITGLEPACPGATAEYHVSPIPGATSYVWTLPNGWTGTSTTESITVVVGANPGSISVAGVNNCGTGVAQVYNATVFTASILPAGPIDICSGSAPVVLTANSGNGFFYQWFNGTTQIPGATSISYTATASGSYKVQVASNSCMATSDPVIVTITQMPDITATSNSPICVGDVLTFSGNSTASGVNYSWTGPSNFPNTQNPSIATASLSDAGTYTLTITEGPCTTTAQVTVMVHQGAPQTPSPISGELEMCAYSSGNIYEVVNDPNAFQYNWTIPNNWSGSSITNAISTAAGLAGNFLISVTAENGCGISNPSTLNVVVHPLPQPVIVQTGNTLSVSSAFATYQWYNGSTAIPGATGQSYTFTQNGNYSVVVTNNEGCLGQSSVLNTSVGVTTANMLNDILLYPNPNTGNFIIEGAFISNDGVANIVIADVTGCVVYQQQLLVSNGKLSAQINMNNAIAPGIYTIKVSSDAANAVIPFVKN